MNQTRRIEFTALWSAFTNGRRICQITKFTMTLAKSCDPISASIQYLSDCAKSLGLSDFIVREVCYNV